MRLQQIIDRLLPREDHFYTFLEDQANVAVEASRALLAAAGSNADHEAVRGLVRKLENDGDKIHDALMVALAATFVTPIDREDIQRLSKRFDDIVDLLDVTARSFVVFQVGTASGATGDLIRLISDACKVLADVTPLLRANKYSDLIARCRKLSELEKEGDRIFREELSRLFGDPSIDAKEILRAREVLDHLEEALDKCHSAAQTLINIAVKHA